MTDEHDEELTRPPVDGEVLENDAIARLRGLPRVRSVHTVFVPQHREPARPEVEKKQGVGVTLEMNPWIPPTRKPVMATMSDFTRHGTQGSTPRVARPPRLPDIEPKSQ
jgi:hypothetical protein